jgi:hypothetical protein
LFPEVADNLRFHHAKSHQEKVHEDNVEPPPLDLREDGVPWTRAGFETAWQLQMTYEAGEDAGTEEREIAAAVKHLREHRIVFHGLRKNAVIMLLEVGCTEDGVGAIVGMSLAGKLIQQFLPSGRQLLVDFNNAAISSSLVAMLTRRMPPSRPRAGSKSS